MRPMMPEAFEGTPPEADFVLRHAARLLAEPDRLEAQVLAGIAKQPSRYGDLKSLLAGRRDHNLTVALARLQEEGLIERRTDVSAKPVVHTYHATPYGVAVMDATERMRKAAAVSQDKAASPLRIVTLVPLGSAKTESLLGLVTKSLDERAIQHKTADWSKLRTKARLSSLIDASAFTIFLVGASDDKPDRLFTSLVNHLKEYPVDSRRHCFLVHRDAEFIEHVADAWKKRDAAPVLQFAVWSDEKDAARSATEITERFMESEAASA